MLIHVTFTNSTVVPVNFEIDTNPSLLALVLKENKDFDTVYNQLFPARNAWLNIGLNLRLDVNTLSNIDEQCRGDSSKALRLMLALWFKTNPSPTWEKLYRSLCSPTVSWNVLAEKIQKFVKEQG